MAVGFSQNRWVLPFVVVSGRSDLDNISYSQGETGQIASTNGTVTKCSVTSVGEDSLFLIFPILLFVAVLAAFAIIYALVWRTIILARRPPESEPEGQPE